jgi:hypothetical protein
MSRRHAPSDINWSVILGDVRADDEETLTASELARMVGLSTSTITNWTERSEQPLQTVATVDGAIRFTWSHLDDFCHAHPSLPGVRKIRRRAQHGKQEGPGEATTVLPEELQMEGLKSLVRDLRSAAHGYLQAALEGARQNEEAAISHRRQIEHFATAFAAMDAALTQLTAPSTIND